ncbi:hypothetical protein Hypma_016581 [Hypsizygus marmoreus]|uniref:Uncharacterized protein n=1 Tax=Hypsizygus marmoreus TaxID=39966 RepID=A0A369J341_HYPMA|nr:hypothetical protein Hypma_016581 [Hypsizygus marmoreus]
MLLFHFRCMKPSYDMPRGHRTIDSKIPAKFPPPSSSHTLNTRFHAEHR